MNREAIPSIGEQAGFDGPGQAVDRLSHELFCLIDLGVLAEDDASAFLEMLDDLLVLLARRQGGDEAPGRELVRLTDVLAADLDLAYRRLGASA